MRLRHPLFVFFAVVLGTVVLDQLSKALVRAAYTPGETLKLVPGVLNLTLTRNTGAAFGLLPGQRPLFVFVTTVVLVVIAIYLWRQRPSSALVIVGLGLVAGGGIGNLIDRVGPRSVTDFLDFAFVDFPVFNLADSAIVVGVGLLIVWLLVSPVPTPARPDEESRERSGAGTGTTGTS